MKSWIKKSLFTVFGASIALGGLTACSSARPWHHDASPEQMAQMQGKMVERIGSKLDLNAEQKQKLQPGKIWDISSQERGLRNDTRMTKIHILMQ